MKRTGMTVSLMMQSFSIIIILLRKVDRICREYSAYFEKVEDQEFSPYHMVQGVKYHIPEPEYYHANTTKTVPETAKPKCILTPTPSIEDLCTWYGRGRGRARHLELHGHRLYGEKTRSLES